MNYFRPSQRFVHHGTRRSRPAGGGSAGTIEPRLFEETAEGLARAEVAIMTSCPPAAPVPPPKALRERGVTVFGGSDNIRDCWSPFGNGDMLDRAALIVARHEMFTNNELRGRSRTRDTRSEQGARQSAPRPPYSGPSPISLWSNWQV